MSKLEGGGMVNRAVFFRVFLAFFLSIICSAQLQATEKPPWSDRVFQHVEKEYGAEALERFRYLYDLAINNRDLPDFEKLELVNKTLNDLPWIADEQHWKSADYWATPLETIATFGGDCEDFAIVKWVLLNHLGISSDHLRLAYVKIRKTGESHMVLLYVENPGLPPGKSKAFVLDNYVDEIKEAKDRKDLLAVYVTDADGNFALINDKNGERSIKGIYEGRKMKKLDDLKKKIKENRQFYQELNDGRPLLPPTS